MKIVVHEEKIRAELGDPEPRKRRVAKQLTHSEMEVFVAKLHGADSDEMARRTGKAVPTVLNLIQAVRSGLGVRNDLELAYLAYERGYVVIEE